MSQPDEFFDREPESTPVDPCAEWYAALARLDSLGRPKAAVSLFRRSRFLGLSQRGVPSSSRGPWDGHGPRSRRDGGERVSCMPTNVAPVPVAAKVNCAADSGTNDPHTERVRRVLQSSMTYGSEAFLARRSGVCLGSTAKQIEGSQRLSAPLLRTALLLHSPDEIAELLSLWLGVPLRHLP